MLTENNLTTEAHMLSTAQGIYVLNQNNGGKCS
jgi:hypothetical protein